MKIIDYKEKQIKKIKNISHTKFNDVKQLIDAINKDKSFYIINKKFWNMCNVDKKSEKGIDYGIYKKNIILIFGNKEELEFKKNKENSNLIYKDFVKNNITICDENNNNINFTKNSKDNQYNSNNL